jgi:hypothetical protein
VAASTSLGVPAPGTTAATTRSRSQAASEQEVAGAHDVAGVNDVASARDDQRTG